MAAAGSHLTNKYAEGYPANRYYGGCKAALEYGYERNRHNAVAYGKLGIFVHVNLYENRPVAHTFRNLIHYGRKHFKGDNCGNRPYVAFG